MITPEQAQKARELVSGFDEEKKKQFLEKYNSLDSEKKAVVVQRLLGSSETPKQEPMVDKASKFDSTISKRIGEVDSSIKSRGDYLDSIASDMASNNILRKGLGFVKTAAIPAVAIESGLSNPMLAMQRGNFNPIDLAKEAYLGASLQKQGQYGDVYRGAIPNKTLGNVVGATAGLGLSLAGPIKVFQSLKRNFGEVSKFSDSLIKDAGQKAIAATNEAEKFVGESISNAYKKIDQTLIDGNAWTKSIEGLPKLVKEEVARVIGDTDTLLPTIENMRKIKSILGKYKPGSFGKDARGLAENIEATRIDESYTGIKSIITSTVAKKIGAKNAEKLLELEEAAARVFRATDEIRSSTVNPRLLLPTKGGKLAKGLDEAGDVSTREAMNIIRSGGGKQAKKLMNKAIRALEIYNTRQEAWKVAGQVVRAATFGGAIGAVGGAAAGRILNKGNSIE